jgi:hypothetical protein
VNERKPIRRSYNQRKMLNILDIYTKESMIMGRGKGFNDKRQDHENQKPKYATDDPEYSVKPKKDKA